jgi:hypothetical protein
MYENEEFDGGTKEFVVSTPLRIPRLSIAAFDPDPLVELPSYTFGTGFEFWDIRSDQKSITGGQSISTKQNADLGPDVAVAKSR